MEESISLRAFFGKRYFNGKNAALAQGAIYLNSALMCIYNGFYITHTQAKAFYIMHIARMGAVKFFKDALNGFLAHAYTIVFYTYYNIAAGAVCGYTYM